MSFTPLKESLETLKGNDSNLNDAVDFQKEDGNELVFYNTLKKAKGIDGKLHTIVGVKENGLDISLNKYLSETIMNLLTGQRSIIDKCNKVISCPEMCKRILLDRGYSIVDPESFKYVDNSNIDIPINQDFSRLVRSLRSNKLDNEKVWTYLVAKSYQYKLNELVYRLCGKREKLNQNSDIIIEARLYPTRKRKVEKNHWKSNPDLAIGCFKKFGKTERQLQSDGDWFCVVESKWFEGLRELDLQQYDENNGLPPITQLTKLIDHALLLNDENGKFPDRVYVTLITPKYFKDNKGLFKRNYQTIFYRYQNGIELGEDLRRCKMPFLEHNYQTMKMRIKNLVLRWVTFEELLGLKNLVVEDNNKLKTDRDSWKQIFSEMGREDLITEFLITDSK
jgi:hypothetical protein